jgi:hypothetical protein
VERCLSRPAVKEFFGHLLSLDDIKIISIGYQQAVLLAELKFGM